MRNSHQKQGVGIGYVPILFFFCVLFLTADLLCEEDIRKLSPDPFHPSVHHDAIREEIEEINTELSKHLCEIEKKIEKTTAAIITADDPRKRETLLFLLRHLEDERLRLSTQALEKIADLRVRDIEMRIAESVETPPPVSSPSPIGGIMLAANDVFDLFGLETEFGGYLKIRLNTDIIRDNKYEDLFEAHPAIYVKLKHPISDGLSFFISARARYDFFTGGSTHYDHRIELDEAYFDISFNAFDLRVGNQIITWGKTDMVNPTDNINALDITRFITGEVDERKLPTFAVTFDYYAKNTIFELVWVPFFQEHRYQLEGTDWAFFRAGVFGEYGGGMFPWADIFDDSSLSIINAVSSDVTSPITPANSPENSQGGIRISSKYRGWDFSLSYLNVFEKYPTLRISEDLRNAIETDTVQAYIEGLALDELSGLFSSRYHRYHMVGFDFATTWEKYGMRGEMAVFFDRYTYTDELEAIKRPFIQYVIGVDRTFGDNFYVNLQFIQKIIFNYDHEIIEDEIQNSFTLYTYDKFFNEKLIPEVRLYYNINDGDFFLTPKITYKYTDTLEFALGVNILEGDPYTIFGYYTDNDQVFFEVKYYF
jgi:hypothetical protein